MNIAFHFDINAIRTEYKAPYYLPILGKLFQTLLDESSSYTHLKIFSGDLLIWEHIQYGTDEESLNKVLEGILGVHFPVWRDIDEKFYQAIFSTSIAVVALEGVSSRVRDTLLSVFKKEDSYLGAIQIYGANRLHWNLYNQALIPQYRYIDKELRILYSSLNDDDKDIGLEEHWRMFPFKSIHWEDIGAWHSIFDTYTSFEHAKRLAALSDTLSDHLLQLVDDVILRIGDLDAKLQSELYSALRTFNLAQTSSDFAQVATSCRRFIEFLADTLYLTLNDATPLLNKEGKPFLNNPYMEKYRRYVAAKLVDFKTEKKFVLIGLEDLDKRLRNLNDFANKGLHQEIISSLDLNRLLIATITITYDLLSLAPPPMELPLEPYEGELIKLFEEVEKDLTDLGGGK